MISNERDNILQVQSQIDHYKDEVDQLQKYKNLYEDARLRLQSMEKMSLIMQKLSNPLESILDPNQTFFIDNLNKSIKKPFNI